MFHMQGSTCQGRRRSSKTSPSQLTVTQLSVTKPDLFAIVSSTRALRILRKRSDNALSGCRKGNRDCDFPKAPNSSKPGNRGKSGRGVSSNHEDSGESQDDEEESKSLETIKDEPESENDPDDLEHKPKTVFSSGKSRKASIQNLNRKHKYRQQAESTAAGKHKARSPSSDSSVSNVSGIQTPASSVPPSARATPLPNTKWAHLKKDLRKYLDYHQQHITNFHYIVYYDPNNFFHNDLIDLALTYEPLLYAVVGFAAYYHTLKQPDGKLSDFLSYYSRSLSLLRKSLSSGETRTEATMLTILQLATFEEHLGDWPNVVGHHRAAHEMLLNMFTVQNFMNTELRRQIFLWYARFDLMVGLLAGNAAILPREWYARCEDYYATRIDPEDIDVENSLSTFLATQRLIALDMASTFSKLPRGLITVEDFVSEVGNLSQRMDSLRERIQGMNDDYYTVTEFPGKQPLSPSDIVDPYVPGGLFSDVLFSLNYMWMAWYGSNIMLTYQSSRMLQQDLPTGLADVALEQCRIYEAIDRWPNSPEGSSLGGIAGLGISALFLPKDERHIMWCRKKMAAVERMGYVYPTTFRSKMADMWKIPEVKHWWLPNDEGFIPLLRDIRAFIQERALAYEETKGDELRDDLRDMKAIFSKLNIDESPRSSPSDTSGSLHTGRSP